MNLRFRTSVFGLQLYEIRLLTSDFRLRSFNIDLQTSDFELQTSDFRLWIDLGQPSALDFELRSLDLGLLT